MPKDRESSWDEHSGQNVVRVNYSLWLNNWHQCYTMTIILCHFPYVSEIFFCPNTLYYRSFIIRSIFFILHFTLCACMFMIHQCEHFCFGCSCLEIKISSQIKSISSWSEIFFLKNTKKKLVSYLVKSKGHILYLKVGRSRNKRPLPIYYFLIFSPFDPTTYMY